MDLYALILHLHPTAATTLPAMLGAQAHAAFLQTIQRAEPSLAAWLHEDIGHAKPFGVSLLAPWSALRQRMWRLHPADTLRLRVTLAGQPLYEAFMASFLRGHYELALGHAMFQTGRIVASGQGEALAGHATTEQLVDEATPQESQRFRFVTPTTWKLGRDRKYFALWPEPRPLFQKLSQGWAQWAEPSLHFDHRPLLAALERDAVILTSHHLRSIHWQSIKPPTQGFIGWARYEVSGSADFQRQIDLLARLAFFSGVGYGGGRGLGVVVRENARGEGTGDAGDAGDNG